MPRQIVAKTRVVEAKRAQVELEWTKWLILSISKRWTKAAFRRHIQAMSAREVRSKDELVAFVFELLDENDAVEWRNETAYAYLQAIAVSLEGNNSSVPTWQLFADALADASK